MAVLTCALLGCLTACDPADKPSSKDRASSPTEQTEADVLPILKPEEPITLRVGSLKGPTTMGLLFLMEDQKNGKTKNDYEFQMATGADELLPLMVSGKLDAALVPANVAAILC
ncbi:MAG: ABC transporter substrate-binding protein, partial [Lachnospiraceae bacterium]|nr:ABC transporter substrate-binding protein [Lachnospiraceae bacterium]